MGAIPYFMLLISTSKITFWGMNPVHKYAKMRIPTKRYHA